MENKDTENWVTKGNKFFEANNYEEAIKCYEKAAQLDPNDASAFYNWGLALSSQAEISKDASLYESACEKCEKATQLDPNDASAFYNWGVAHFRLAEISKDASQYESACEKYDKATQLDANYAFAFYNWGFALFRLAKINKDEGFQKKLKTFDKASGKIDDPDINLIKGELYFILYQTEKKQEYENEVKECFKKSKKSILEILTFLDRDNEEKIIKTEILHSLLDLKTTEDGKFFIETIGSKPEELLKKYKDIYLKVY